MPHKVEDRKTVPQELRSIGEISAVGDDGIFEGYLTVWDTVDDHNSTFKRGSFKKTIQERGSRIKILFDHEELIGSSVELREDATGVFGRGKLNLDVEKARETYAFMKDGTLEGLSFRFRPIKEGFKDGVREIREIKLYEFGPVMFPSNDSALVTDVRSENFNETLDESMLRNEGVRIFDAIQETVMDIWFSPDIGTGDIVNKLDEELANFHAAYLDFATRWIETFFVSDDGLRNSPMENDLAKVFNAYLEQRRITLEELSSRTSFKLEELTELRKGNLITNRNALSELSEDIKLTHRKQRNKAVETLCSELRDKFTNSEKMRISALLTPVEERQQSEPDAAAQLLQFFKQQNGE